MIVVTWRRAHVMRVFWNVEQAAKFCQKQRDFQLVKELRQDMWDWKEMFVDEVA